MRHHNTTLVPLHVGHVNFGGSAENSTNRIMNSKGSHDRCFSAFFKNAASSFSIVSRTKSNFKWIRRMNSLLSIERSPHWSNFYSANNQLTFKTRTEGDNLARRHFKFIRHIKGEIWFAAEAASRRCHSALWLKFAIQEATFFKQ